MTRVPALHQQFLDRALPLLQADSRLLGTAVGGSWLRDAMDEYSDLDLVIVVDPAAYESVMHDRMAIAESIGDLLSGFTGEHVGEPRLIINLYGPPLLHVDLKFVSLDDLPKRVEDPAILWEREGAMSRAFASEAPYYPQRDLQWMEDRFWVWIHYTAAHLGRGELFETIDALTSIRGMVIGPLLAIKHSLRQRGVRQIEQYAVDDLLDVIATHPAYDARSCGESALALARAYQRLRDELAPPDLLRRTDAEREALRYLQAEIDRQG